MNQVVKEKMAEVLGRIDHTTDAIAALDARFQAFDLGGSDRPEAATARDSLQSLQLRTQVLILDLLSLNTRLLAGVLEHMEK
jgi:hypothetical protein